MTMPKPGEHMERVVSRFVRELNAVTAWMESQTHPDTIVEATVLSGRQCEACAQGERCERLERMTRAAWRQGEAATDG